MANKEIFDKLTNAIVTQNIAACVQLTKEALGAGIPPLDIISKGLAPGMKIIGDKFEAAEVFLPQIMMSGKAMSSGEEREGATPVIDAPCKARAVALMTAHP